MPKKQLSSVKFYDESVPWNNVIKRRINKIMKLEDKFFMDNVFDKDETKQDGHTWDEEEYIKFIKDFFRNLYIRQGKKTITYKKNRQMESLNIKRGREYASYGGQSLQNDIKGWIYKDLYTDYDIVNCQPTVLLYLTNKYFPDVKTYYLNNYIRDRENCLNTIKFKHHYRDNKTLIISIINGGGKKYINETNNDWFNCFYEEINEIIEEWYLNTPKDFNILPKERPKGHKKGEINLKGSFISKVCADFESQLLEEAIEYCIREGDQVIKMFDGFMTTRKNLLPKLNEIGEQYGITWKIKDLSLRLHDKFKLDEGYESEEPLNEAELAEEILKIELLSYEGMISQMNKEWCFIEESAVFYRRKERANGTFVVNEYNKEKARLLCAPLLYEEWCPEKKRMINKEIFMKWIQDEERKTYYRIIFRPSLNNSLWETDELNIFQGFDIQNNKFHLEDKDYNEIGLPFINKFIELLKLLTNNEVTSEGECWKYLLNYICHMFQKPEERPEVIVCFKGLEGVGKDLMFRVLSCMIGKACSYDIQDLNSIGDFQDILVGKVLMNFNETEGSQADSNMSKVKHMLTAEQLPINPKGKTPFTQDNYMRIFSSTNKDITPWQVSSTQRRFQLFQTGFKQKTEWYDILYEGINKNNEKYNICMHSLYNYLCEYDISGYKPRDLYKTKQMKAVGKQNIKVEHQFLHAVFNKSMWIEEETDIYKYKEPWTNDYINDYIEENGVVFIKKTELWNSYASYYADRFGEEGGLSVKTKKNFYKLCEALPEYITEKLKKAKYNGEISVRRNYEVRYKGLYNYLERRYEIDTDFNKNNPVEEEKIVKKIIKKKKKKMKIIM